MADSFDVLLERKEKQSFHVPGILDDKKDFDGPLDLLLFLISKNDANIYDIPISLITEQFLDYISLHGTELDDLADFYRLAAELLYIKSRLLLPHETQLDEEYEDPRQDLVDRLIDYQKYKKYTDLLTGQDKSGRLYISRPENLFAIPFEDKELFSGVTLSDITRTFASILKKTPPSKIFNIYQPVSIKEKRALMMELLEENDEIRIEDLIVDFSNPLHIICSFLSILEAAKDHTILFRQEKEYETIYIHKRPQNWDPRLVDDYDKEADIYEAEGLEDPEDFTILSRDAEMRLEDLVDKKAKEREKDEEPVVADEFTGVEEVLEFEDDEDDDDE